MSRTKPDPIRPQELVEGGQYLLRSTATPQQACHPETWESVRFVGYTSCPAVVIVAVGRDKRMPIARDQLFMLSCPNLLAPPAARSRPSLS